MPLRLYLSVLCYEPERTDQPAIASWNSVAPESLVPATDAGDGERSALKRRAIDSWENEGGEIPNVTIPQPAAMSAVRSPGKKLFVFDLDGTPAESKAPLDPHWWRTIKQARARWAEVDGDQRAAAFGYYLLLSLLPLTILLVSASSLFAEREVATRAIVELVNHYTPLTSEQERGAVATIRDWLNARGKISLAALPLLLWGALKFLRTLIRTTNRVWHAHTYNWWRLPLKSLGLLGITATAVLIGILLPAVAGLVRDWLTTQLRFPQWAFALIFHLIPGLILFYGLIMIYKLAPSRRTRFSEVWLGALAATVLIWLGERLFLVYAANFAHFNVLYGALGGIVASLLWLYLSGCVGVFGICFCAAQAELRGSAHDHPQKHCE